MYSFSQDVKNNFEIKEKEKGIKKFIEDVELALDYHQGQPVAQTSEEVSHATVNLNQTVRCLWDSFQRNELGSVLSEEELVNVDFLLKELEILCSAWSMENFSIIQENILRFLKSLKPCCRFSLPFTFTN